MMVDTHTHVVAEDHQRYPFQPTGPTLNWYKEMPITGEQLLERMDEAGMDRAVLVQGLSSYGYDNSYTADCATRYPARFVSVCIIDVFAPDAPARLKYWVEERGMCGIRLFSTAWPENTFLDDPRTFPVWEQAAALGITINIVMRQHQVPHLKRTLERFPGIPVALDHLGGMLEGGPPYEAVQNYVDLATFPNLHLKYSTVNLDALSRDQSSPQNLLQRLVNSFGPQRLTWGSNFPATYDRPYKEMVELAKNSLSFLPSEARDWMLGKTALGLWPR